MKHFAICILLILTACNPCKRLAKLCPPSDSTSYVETIDTVIVTVPGSVSETEISLGSLGITNETEDQKIEVIVKDSIVYIRTTCKEQETEIYNLRKKLASVKTRIERIEIPTYVYRNSKYHTVAGIVAPVLILLIAAFVYFRIRKV